jgi:anti-sigma factor RsiW
MWGISMTQISQHPCPDEISAYIDGELPADEERNTQQHLANCHFCALRVLSGTQLKAATARAGHCFAPAPEAVARLTARLHAEPSAVARIRSIRPIAWGALAAAVVLALSLLGWSQIRRSNTLAAELLDEHLAVLASSTAPQVISSDRHTVKPWFQGRLPFSFNLPESEALPPDTTLKGADLTYFDGQPAALLIFTIHKHQVTVILTQQENDLVLTGLPKGRAGFTIHSATASHLHIIAVSDVNPAELDLLIAVLARVQT